MLVDRLDPVPDEVWIAVFAVATLLYGGVLLRRYRGMSTSDGRSRHEVPHFVECLAMLYMFLALPAGHATMVMPAEGSARWPALAFVLALLIFGHAVWTAIALTPLVVEPVPGQNAAPEPADLMPVLDTVHGGGLATAVTRRTEVATVPAAGRWSLRGPYLSEFCEIGMGVVMSYALLLML
jgi:hypothetical protein